MGKRGRKWKEWGNAVAIGVGWQKQVEILTLEAF